MSDEENDSPNPPRSVEELLARYAAGERDFSLKIFRGIGHEHLFGKLNYSARCLS